MKKTSIILAATAAIAFSVVSCNKAETPGISSPLQVNITVADLTPATKAVKTGWAAGDVINVYVQTSDFYGEINNPEITLTYNGSKWVSSAISEEAKTKLASGSKLMGFWEGSNGVATYTKESFYWDFPGNSSLSSTTGIEGYVVATFKDIAYTYSGDALTASITGWEFLTRHQIVVSGITYESGRYTLYSDKLSNCSAIYCYGDNVSLSFNTSGSDGRIAGIPNADGVAFVGGGGTGTGIDITLHLIDNTTEKKYSVSKSGVTFTYTLNAVKIPFSAFTEE